jgi:LysM repeat protein
VKLQPALPFVACCALALAFVLGACGGGGSGNKVTDSSKVPTATLPATLPEVRVLSGAVVQQGGALSYTIKEGDTLAGVAARLGVALEDLLAANAGIDPGALRVGQTIRLPDNTEPVAAAPTQSAAAPTPAPVATEPPPAATEPAPIDTPVVEPPTPAPEAPTATPSSLGQSYVVQEGDYPASIAEKFGITVEEFLAANPGLNPTDMHIGDVVIIPPKAPA